MDPRVQLVVLCVLTGLGYVLMVATNPAAAHFGDGMRCLLRHPVIWRIPAGFGVVYAVFLTGLELWYLRMETGADSQISWLPAWEAGGGIAAVARDGVWPAVQHLSGLFGNMFPVFPASVLFGWALLFNWRGSLRELRLALTRRWGVAGGFLFGALTLCAFAAGLKVFIYPALFFAEYLGTPSVVFAWCSVIDWLSGLFEFFTGVGFQVLIILVVRFWVVGAVLDREEMWRLAVRRLGFVMKWGTVVLVLNSVLLHVPLVLSHFSPAVPRLDAMLGWADVAGRWIIAGVLIVFCSMQVGLALHNDSFRNSVRANFAFLGRHGFVVVWFFIIASIHLYAFSIFNVWMLDFLGENTVPWALWRCVVPLGWAMLTGWLLASWVCLYKLRSMGLKRVVY